MLTLFGSLVPGVFFTGRFDATPGVDTPDDIIDGFPEFTQDVSLISDPTVKAKLRALAKRIVASHNTRRKIIGFETHGHADATVRIADRTEAERTENEVSQERADNAKDLLLQMIEEEGGKPIIGGIRANAKAQGFGSRFRIFKPAQTEVQMKRNRRVEIFLKEISPPPPRPAPPPPPPPPQKVQGSNWRVQILDGTTTTVAVPGTDAFSSLSILLNVEITDVDRRQKAKFRVLTTGSGTLGASSSPSLAFSTSAVRSGDPKDFKVPNGTTIQSFAGSVEVTISPGASASFLSTGGDFGFAFNNIDATGSFTSPSVVEAGAGADPLGFPQANFGGITTGSITMKGDPTTF